MRRKRIVIEYGNQYAPADLKYIHGNGIREISYF